VRVVTLTCDGETQRHLMRRIARKHDLVGGVTMSTAPSRRSHRVRTLIKRYRNPVTLLRHLEGRRWQQQQSQHARELHDAFFMDDSVGHSMPDVPHLHVHDINAPDCLAFVQDLRPDVIVVNGTNLLRSPWFELQHPPRCGILNIHTGLSPYCRGGNCNLFAILHGQMQAVGVTVHYIDSGIDSGDIIYTDRPRISRDDCFASLEEKVFRLGEDLMMVALDNADCETVNSTRQWTDGHLFLKRTGYVFEPFYSALADRRLQDEGLLEQYLQMKDNYDNSVRVLPPSIDPKLWRHPLV
jgi:methionyl-tRNA formyltransferase